MARDQVSAASAAIKSLDGGAFVTLHSRIDQGGALQARKLTNGAVKLHWRYSLGGETSRERLDWRSRLRHAAALARVRSDLQCPVLPFLAQAGDAGHLSQRIELALSHSTADDAKTPIG